MHLSGPGKDSTNGTATDTSSQDNPSASPPPPWQPDDPLATTDTNPRSLHNDCSPSSESSEAAVLRRRRYREEGEQGQGQGQEKEPPSQLQQHQQQQEQEQDNLPKSHHLPPPPRPRSSQHLHTHSQSYANSQRRPQSLHQYPRPASVSGPSTPVLTRRSNASTPANSRPASIHHGDHLPQGGWIAGLTEAMANISSRVVNTRSQENPGRVSIVVDSPDAPQYRFAHGVLASTVTTPTSPNPGIPPWVAGVHQEYSNNDPTGSNVNSNRHLSVGDARSAGQSEVSGGLNPASTNSDSGGPHPRPRNSHSSAPSKSTARRQSHSAPMEPKPVYGDEESIFAPGGFSHRVVDTKAIVLEGKSFMVFAPNNPIRLWLASIIMSRYTDPVILLIILAQWILFVLTPMTETTKNVFGSYWTHYALLAINIVYTIEILSKGIVYGLFFDVNGCQWKSRLIVWVRSYFHSAPTSVLSTRRQSIQSVSSSTVKLNGDSNHGDDKPYQETMANAPAPTTQFRFNSAGEPLRVPLHAPFIQSYFNRLDFLVVICYWIDLCLMLSNVDDIYLFKGISAMRPLRLLALTEGTSTILSSLSIAAPLLLNILLFIFFFLTILSLVGLLLFKGSLSRRCAMEVIDKPGSWSPVQPEMICGGYYSNGTMLGIINYMGQGDGDDSSPRPTALICPEGQVCMQFVDYNPSLGLVSYDNVLLSMLTTFTVSSMEGWTDVQYWVMDGDSRWAAVFFCVTIFLMSFLLIPLSIAGITYSFGSVRAKKRHSAFSNKVRSARVLLDTEDGWQFKDQIKETRSIWKQTFMRIVNHPWFETSTALIVLADLICMSLRRHDAPMQLIFDLDEIELAFTIYFAIEIVVRILGHANFQQFAKFKNNRMDLFLAIVTCIIQIPAIRNWEWYRYLTVFQVLRCYRLVPCIPGVQDILNSIIGSASGMMNLILITFMFLLVCCPIPMMLFGGDMETNADEQPIDFDDLGRSFVSLFIILTGENWINIMYNGLDAHRGTFQQLYGAAFFVIFYCVSHYILLNLFIAIVLEQFELEDDEKYKKQLEMYFSQHQKSHRLATESSLHYLNPYAYFPAHPQNLKVDGLPPDLTVTIKKSVFRQLLESDSVPDTIVMLPRKPWFMRAYERTRDYWFPDQAQLVSRSLSARTGAGDDSSLHEHQPHQQQHNVSGHAGGGGTTVSEKGIDPASSSANFGFGLTQDDIDTHLESLGAGLDRLNLSLKVGNLEVEGDLRNKGATSEAARYRKGLSREEDFYQASKQAAQKAFLEEHPMHDRSLFIFSSSNRFRQWCQKLVGSSASRKQETMNRFNWFIFICILVSIGVVIADDPVNRLYALVTGDRSHLDLLATIDDITIFIFMVEQALRILADGAILTPDAYLKNPWNVLDLVIVAMSVIMTFNEISHSFAVSRFIRALYCLRVLRVIRYFDGISSMFRAIAKAMPQMVTAMAFTAMLFFPFAIYGINIYAGYFFKCNDQTVAGKSDCTGTFLSAPSDEQKIYILIPRVWQNPYSYSFDDFWSASLVLFEMASQEGWVLVMQSGRAVPEQIGMQPNINESEPYRFNTFYFIIFMLLGSIVFVQIFIGVILETFKTWNGISLLTVEQRRWLDLRRQLRLIKPTATPARPKNKFRRICFDMVVKKKGVLWHVMTLVLVLNVCLIATQHYDQSELLTDIQDISYFIFLAMYTFEIFVKICGFGFRKWRLSRWNLYDFVITVLAILTLIPRFLGHELWTLRLEKFLLITISFRLAQRIDSLQSLFQAFGIAGPSILNMTALFMIVLAFYAIMFREIFGMTRMGPSTNLIANFRTFGSSLLMLIRMCTGENWDFVMHDMMLEPPFCTINRTSYLLTDCGSKPWAYLLFLSFYIICTYIILNMFIAVVISNFSFAYEQVSITTLVTRDDLRAFKLTWARFDPRGTGYIQADQLSAFLRSLTGRFSTLIYENPEFSVPNLVATSRLGFMKASGGDSLVLTPAELEELRINGGVDGPITGMRVDPGGTADGGTLHLVPSNVTGGTMDDRASQISKSRFSLGNLRRRSQQIFSHTPASSNLTSARAGVGAGAGESTTLSTNSSSLQPPGHNGSFNADNNQSVPAGAAAGSSSLNRYHSRDSIELHPIRHQQASTDLTGSSNGNQQYHHRLSQQGSSALTNPELNLTGSHLRAYNANRTAVALKRLQATLNRLDPATVTHRRRQLNLVFREAMASNTEQGISFYSVLDILSYTLVDTEQALGMEDFLKRNDRVEEIKSAVSRELVYNLLQTIVKRHRFARSFRLKREQQQQQTNAAAVAAAAAAAAIHPYPVMAGYSTAALSAAASGSQQSRSRHSMVPSATVPHYPLLVHTASQQPQSPSPGITSSVSAPATSPPTTAATTPGARQRPEVPRIVIDTSVGTNHQNGGDSLNRMQAPGSLTPPAAYFSSGGSGQELSDGDDFSGIGGIGGRRGSTLRKRLSGGGSSSSSSSPSPSPSSPLFLGQNQFIGNGMSTAFSLSPHSPTKSQGFFTRGGGSGGEGKSSNGGNISRLLSETSGLSISITSPPPEESPSSFGLQNDDGKTKQPPQPSQLQQGPHPYKQSPIVGSPMSSRSDVEWYYGHESNTSNFGNLPDRRHGVLPSASSVAAGATTDALASSSGGSGGKNTGSQRPSANQLQQQHTSPSPPPPALTLTTDDSVNSSEVNNPRIPTFSFSQGYVTSNSVTGAGRGGVIGAGGVPQSASGTDSLLGWNQTFGQRDSIMPADYYARGSPGGVSPFAMGRSGGGGSGNGALSEGGSGSGAGIGRGGGNTDTGRNQSLVTGNVLPRSPISRQSSVLQSPVEVAKISNDGDQTWLGLLTDMIEQEDDHVVVNEMVLQQQQQQEEQRYGGVGGVSRHY